MTAITDRITDLCADIDTWRDRHFAREQLATPPEIAADALLVRSRELLKQLIANNADADDKAGFSHID